MPKKNLNQNNQDHSEASTPSNKPSSEVANSSTSTQALTTTSTSGTSSHAGSSGLRIFVVPSSDLEDHNLNTFNSTAEGAPVCFNGQVMTTRSAAEARATSDLTNSQSSHGPSYPVMPLKFVLERETTLEAFTEFFAPQLDGNRINDLRAELAAARRALLVAQSNFTARLANVETRATQAEATATNQKIEIDALKQRLQLEVKTQIETHSTIENQNSSIKSLQEKLQELMQLITQIRTACDTLKNKLTVSTAELNQEREKLAILTAQLDNENKEYVKLQTTLIDEQTMQQNLRDQLAASELAKHDLQQKLAAAETSLTSLASTAASTQNEPMQRRILSLQNELDAIRIELTAEQTKVSQTASSLKIVSEQKVRFELQATSYQRRLENAKNQFDAIKAELAQAKQQAASAQTSLSDYQQQLASANTLLENRKAETIVFNRTLNDLHERVRQDQAHQQAQLATVTAQKFQLITERDHAHQEWQNELRLRQALEQELARIQHAQQARAQQQQAQQYQPQYQQRSAQSSSVPNPQVKRLRDEHDLAFAQDDRSKRSTTESSHQSNNRAGFFRGQPQSVPQQRQTQGPSSGPAEYRR